MNKKAFTLIELLAVIVILAIIALIAVPIVLNIINDTKKSSVERSRELYLHAVELAIANKNLNEEFNPSTCTVIENGNLSCDTGILNVEVNGSVPKVGGTITLKDWDIISDTLDFGNGSNGVQTDTIGKAVTESNKTLAGNIPQGNYEPGDEYIVNVDEEHEYHFYVLSTEGDKVNLIMSNNICSDGTLATSENRCNVDWNSGENATGPVIAMDYLYEATKNWNKIENIKMNYTDEGFFVETDSGEYGYGTVQTLGSTTSITKKDGTVTKSYENLKSRMITISEIKAVGCNSDGGSCPVWLVNGLSEYSRYPEGTKENIAFVDGYWTMSSSNGGSLTHYAMYYRGTLSTNSNNGYVSEPYGIRPVITVSKSDLQ